LLLPGSPAELSIELARFAMQGVLAAPLAELLQLDPVRIVLLALHRRVVPPLAVRTR